MVYMLRRAARAGSYFLIALCSRCYLTGGEGKCGSFRHAGPDAWHTDHFEWPGRGLQGSGSIHPLDHDKAPPGPSLLTSPGRHPLYLRHRPMHRRGCIASLNALCLCRLQLQPLESVRTVPPETPWSGIRPDTSVSLATPQSTLTGGLAHQ